MAYSFPPRGFTVDKNDICSPENGKVTTDSQKIAQSTGYNSSNNKRINNGTHNLGFCSQQAPTTTTRPVHPYQFPNEFGGNWMPPGPRHRGPRSCYYNHSSSMQTFQQQPFDNNWPRPRPFRHDVPGNFQGIHHDIMSRGAKRSHNIQNGQSSIKKKSKKNFRKNDLAEKLDFNCDRCDRGFKTEDKFQEHINSHVKCEYPGCSFEGAFKIVRQHKGMQHAPNSKPIGRLETSEEIEKWKEERRKRYPSFKNVMNKETKLNDRIRSGNVLKTKEFGKMKHKSEIMDKSNKSHPKSEHQELKENIVGSLGSLVASYGSDSENSSEEGEIREETKTPVPSAPPLVPQINNAQAVKKMSWQEKRKLRKKETKFKKNRGKVEIKKRKNLLEMLLAGDIRHERNVLLQCLKYIINKGFFDTNA
ncbi:FMR1-interacting protein NUFIP1-like isoform X2 [Antedon mediterranea]|uniref:FMR1-interacting protein NUFIP1-like isoform X2 n=1 Tax=Antedon mediterranea TaxID=105859 RepID=UPI003AF9C7E8